MFNIQLTKKGEEAGRDNIRKEFIKWPVRQNREKLLDAINACWTEKTTPENFIMQGWQQYIRKATQIRTPTTDQYIFTKQFLQTIYDHDQDKDTIGNRNRHVENAVRVQAS